MTANAVGSGALPARTVQTTPGIETMCWGCCAATNLQIQLYVVYSKTLSVTLMNTSKFQARTAHATTGGCHRQFWRPWTRAYTLLNPLCIETDAAASRQTPKCSTPAASTAAAVSQHIKSPTILPTFTGSNGS